MAYSELIKNFEKIRDYIREMYVYGFKSRSEYDAKSARSYDDERRRVESWLGDHIRFSKTPEGKSVFLSVDSRTTKHNPFFKAWKAKSFTDGDITLHFMLFDILNTPDVKMTLAEIIDEIDSRLKITESPLTFDESTIRKKLKEYSNEGIITIEKQGRKSYYRRARDTDISNLGDVLDFFSEVAPCGVIGSFLCDKLENRSELFCFKHHYINHAMDSDVMAAIFTAMQQKRYITAETLSRKSKTKQITVVPIKIYISSQYGRQYLIAYHQSEKRLHSIRLDHLSNIKAGDICEKFDDLRNTFTEIEKNIWGVYCHFKTNNLERIEFEIEVSDGEQYVVQRLEREKRCGTVEKIDDNHYRYIAYVFDSKELFPWIRSFISRITRLNFSNRTAENLFKQDIEEMYRLYGINGDEPNDIQ